MEEMNDLISKLQRIMGENARYKLEAYSFVLAALNYTVAKLEKPRHVTGRELCEGIREFAREQYGPLSYLVFEHWGITRTRDFGELVFALVDAGLMSKTEQDSIADFADVYDLKEAFKKASDFDLEDLDTDWNKDKKDVGGYG